MKINVSLYNSQTNDLAIVIDLLRASTTISVALNTFKRIVPINDIDEAIKLKEKHNAILAGEIKSSDFDVSNSPVQISNYAGDTLILKTTNGTKVLENIKQRNSEVNILVGASINAKTVVQKALDIADNEIELVMAGRHQRFTIEDCIGAGIIINEMVNIAKEKNIYLELSESAKASKIISNNSNIIKQLINTSHSADKLRYLGFGEDIEICSLINKIDTVPIYKNNYIVSLD